MSEMSLGLSAAGGESKPESKPYFFEVSIPKLIVMSMVTLNFYQIYWFYKNWQMAKERGEEVMPIPRAIFGVLFAYPLFKEVRSVGQSAGVDVARSAGALAFLYFLLQVTWRLSDTFWILALVTVLPLALVQHDVAHVHRALGAVHVPNDGFTWLNIVAIIFGSLLLMLGLIRTFFPAEAG